MVVPIYKFYFENRNESPHKLIELSCDVDGWKNYGVTFGKESGISNIVKSYTNNWVFVLGDADYLKSAFYKYGSNAKVRLVVKKLTNFLQKKYEIEFAGYFDFSQIKISSTVSIPIAEGGFFKLLENKWSKDYEIEMNNAVLGFNGVKIPESAIMESTGSKTFTGSDGSQFKSLTVGLSPKNTIKKYDFFQKCQTNDVTLTGAHTIDMGFLVFKSGFIDNFKIGYNVNVTFSLKGVLPVGIIYSYLYKIDCYILEFDYNQIEQGSLAESDALRKIWISDQNASWIGAWGNTFALNYQYKYNKSGSLSIIQNGSNGKVYIMKLNLLLNGVNISTSLETKIDYHTLFLNCSLETMLNKNRDFQCIKINDVFQKLIESINNNKHTVEIDFTELNKCVANDTKDRFDVLTNGNGLRGRVIVLTQEQIDILEMGGINIPNMPEYSYAKLTTSLEQLLKFLYIVYGLKIVLNYDKISDKYLVSMAHEDLGFSNNLIQKYQEVDGLQLSVERSYLYTSIKVGYTNKDDSIGGKEEYNGTLEFQTMITEREENVLDLVSPYSASVFDIETFLYNNYQNFKDSADKDNEIFVISCKKHPHGLGYFSLRRGVPVHSGIAYHNSAWNVELSPRRMLNNHTNFINSCFAFHVGDKLTISTAKRNKTLDAGDVVESDPFIISSNRSFYPIILEFRAPATNDLINKIEKVRNGFIEFEYNGATFKGYIHSSSGITVNPMNEKESEFVLLCHGEELPKI